MSKGSEIIFGTIALVVVSLSAIGLTSFYGDEDWVWIAQINTAFVLVFIVLFISLVALLSWLRR